MTDKAIYEIVILEDDVKEYQIRLSVKEFRGIEYLHIRRYYRDFFGDWMPSSEGIAMELDISSTAKMFQGLVELLSIAEAKNLLEEHFKDTLDTIYDT